MESHQRADFHDIPEKFSRGMKYLGHGLLKFGDKGSIVYVPEAEPWYDGKKVA